MHLAIRGVSKQYPNGVRAVHDITLDIPRGMYGVLGPNGAGKSTLMRTIATLQEPDSGSIMLGDINVLRKGSCATHAGLPAAGVRCVSVGER